MVKHLESTVSLSEVHSTVEIPKRVGLLKKLFAFAGPAYLVSVGYMDPGNWATDLEGGARFGYQLIWVLLMSNLMAILLQTLAARLGIVAGRDLAQACREAYAKPAGYALWILCEIAIAACDLAELLGTAIGLNLLFGVPLLYGVLITGLDTLLFFALQNFGIRKLEAFILVLVATIGACFSIEVILARPDWHGVVQGFAPHLTSESLYVAVGILGATVMPHNLYLHSALVQTRAVGQTEEERRTACTFNFVDTTIALNAAFLVNAAILIVAAAVFFKNGVIVTEIQQAHELLTPLLGSALASTLFAIALISSGQSSTLTGTLAGQIVMEGFLQFRIRPVLRRLITRLLAMIPAVIVITLKGEGGSYDLLILSQVVLSMQLPFAVIPLIRFTSSRSMMGSFINRPVVRALAWITAAVIVGLNANLVYETLSGWIEEAGDNAVWIWVTVLPLVVGLVSLLIHVSFTGLFAARRRAQRVEPAPALELSTPSYRRIGVAIDFGPLDNKVLSHAGMLARTCDADLTLFHVVEGAIGQEFGKEAFGEEARQDAEQLNAIARQLEAGGRRVTTALGFGRVPVALVRLAREHKVDVLVMGGHGHRGLKDLVFGASISEVRHQLSIPVLVVQ